MKQYEFERQHKLHKLHYNDSSFIFISDLYTVFQVKLKRVLKELEKKSVHHVCCLA
jgi:hypothetical protein